MTPPLSRRRFEILEERCDALEDLVVALEEIVADGFRLASKPPDGWGTEQGWKTLQRLIERVDARRLEDESRKNRTRETE